MSDQPQKTKAQLRAERRAIQEAQRAAKQAAKEAKSVQKPETTKPVKSKEKTTHPVVEIPSKEPVRQPSAPKTTDSQSTLESIVVLRGPFPSIPTRKQEPNRVHLFRHLREPDRRVNVLENFGLGSSSPIHPAFLALGSHLDEGRIWGSNEIALHFLAACETLIRSQPSAAVPNSSFTRDFGPVLERHFNFLAHCRSPTVSLYSANQFMKQLLNQLDSIRDWEECRSQLLSEITEFRQQSIYLAGAEIAERGSAYIRPGDCVCTFGHSSVVARVLLRTWFGDDKFNRSKTNNSFSSGDSRSSDSPQVPFSVMVVDARPMFKGRRMLARLTKAGIPCEYTHIAALPSLAHKISLAIVGADALLNNGYVLAGIGTAQVANIVWDVARAPTLVCAETYKFWERAQSDAFEFNELGDPDDIWRGPLSFPSTHGCGPTVLPTGGGQSTADLKEWRSNPRMHLLHLTYDVLPPSLVSAVITEKGTLPTTSVPVVLRVKQASVPL